MSIENPDRGTFLPFSRRDLNAPDPSLSISVPRRRSFPVSQMRRPEKTPAVFTPSPQPFASGLRIARRSSVSSDSQLLSGLCLISYQLRDQFVQT